jgi:enterochelin esterase-like enzyme
LLLSCAGACLLAAESAPAKGTLDRVTVHGRALEGDLNGDSADRSVTVYLPPGYAADTARRYPVVYLLHGYTDNDDKWMGFTKHWINLPEVLDAAYANTHAAPMIFVMPNAYTRFKGSMYSNSAATGNWEDYIVRELVAYVDAHYRTIARAAARGLAGHSMGGYGALRIGMKHPDVFSSVYLLSPCCLAPATGADWMGQYLKSADAVKTIADADKADFMTSIVLASAAAWSPNPAKPPLYFDLPQKDGVTQPEILAKWIANAPLAQIDQYIANLRQLRGLAFDAGDKDQPIATIIGTLDGILNAYHVKHGYEIYQGDHLNHIADRITTKLLPFFTTNLGATPAAK